MLSPDTAAEEAKCKDLDKVVIGGTQGKFFQVGAQLPPQEKEGLIEFLKKNIDVFAWEPEMLQGLTQHSSVPISMSTHPSPPRNSHSTPIKKAR